MSDSKQHLTQEIDELHDKTVKLERFLASGTKVVSDEYMALQAQQLTVMKQYENILLRKQEMLNG